MAWQLIYTSAPRSLEAGRSGFGTVARHRAISPLLVSAIERASQFSRLPGTDAGRVIYSHRIVAVAGGRFHVLSAIRDAGADYTGRTNHIAHHLIVDPREIAQLGPDGPSPADVLLSMQWAVSWNEPPRFLEASDEVALSAIHPHTGGSAWEQITGSATQAWLLATGDASRGAYIIQPESADLREVYSESLRLIPDRLWQISFTTSLQPSDEPGDFRWIGIEERSPLRAQSESSGRPVLNLALPDTLPLVETVQRPAVSQIRQNSEPASAPAWNDLPTASTETSPAVPGSHSSPTRQRTGAISGASPKKSSRIPLKWWLLAGAVAAVALIGAVIFSTFVKPYLQTRTARNALAKSFEDSAYFPHEICQRLADDLITSADGLRCKELAGAASTLIQTLRAGDLQKLKLELTSDNLNVMADGGGLKLPEELADLRKTVAAAQRLSDKPAGFEKAREVNELVEIMQKRYGEISKLDPENRLRNLVEVLHANADEQQAEGLLTIIEQRMPPPGGIEKFKQIVADLKKKKDLNPAAKTTIGKVEDSLAKHVAKSQPTSKPEPVKSNPSSPMTKGEIEESHKTSVPKARAPFYFARSIDAISKVNYPQLKSAQAFYIQEGISSTPKKLLMPPAFAGKLYRKDTADGEIFSFEPKTGTITPGTDKGKIQSPYFLIARNSEDTDVITFCVVPPNDGLTDCLLGPPRDGEIRPPDKKARIDFAALRLPAFQDVRFELRLTKEWALPGKSSEIRVSVDNESGLLDTESLSNEAATLKGRHEGKKKTLENAHPVDHERRFLDSKSEFLEKSGIKQTISQQRSQMGNTSELTKMEGILGLDAAPLIKQYGGCIEAFTVSNNFQLVDDLFNAAQALKNPNLKEDDQAGKLNNAAKVIERVINNLRSTGKEKEEKGKFGPPLELLKKMITGPQSQTPQAKKELGISEGKRSKELKDCEENLRILVAHPVFEKNQFPSGIYRLFAILEGQVGIPVLDIKVK